MDSKAGADQVALGASFIVLGVLVIGVCLFCIYKSVLDYGIQGA